MLSGRNATGTSIIIRDSGRQRHAHKASDKPGTAPLLLGIISLLSPASISFPQHPFVSYVRSFRRRGEEHETKELGSTAERTEQVIATRASLDPTRRWDANPEPHPLPCPFHVYGEAAEGGSAPPHENLFIASSAACCNWCRWHLSTTPLNGTTAPAAGALQGRCRGGRGDCDSEDICMFSKRWGERKSRSRPVIA